MNLQLQNLAENSFRNPPATTVLSLHTAGLSPKICRLKTASEVAIAGNTIGLRYYREDLKSLPELSGAFFFEGCNRMQLNLTCETSAKDPTSGCHFRKDLSNRLKDLKFGKREDPRRKSLIQCSCKVVCGDLSAFYILCCFYVADEAYITM